MPVNYSSLSLDKLRKEKNKIEKAIEAKEGKARREALAKMKSIARESGIDLSELVPSTPGNTQTSKAKTVTTSSKAKKKASAKRGKVAPKYRNPADPNVTWTGRGRQPVWVREYLSTGGSIDTITI